MTNRTNPTTPVNLIEDVRPAESPKFFDVRNPAVKVQSIGELQKRYTRQQRRQSRPRQAVMTASNNLSLGQPAYPAMALLMQQIAQLIAQANMEERFTNMRAELMASWQHFISSWSLTPQHYSLKRGLRFDWHTRTFAISGRLLPVFLIWGAAAVLLLMSGPSAIIAKSPDHQRPTAGQSVIGWPSDGSMLNRLTTGAADTTNWSNYTGSSDPLKSGPGYTPPYTPPNVVTQFPAAVPTTGYGAGDPTPVVTPVVEQPAPVVTVPETPVTPEIPVVVPVPDTNVPIVDDTLDTLPVISDNGSLTLPL